MRSCGKATTPTQPSVNPIAADSHFGARTQQSFKTIARNAPLQMIARIGIAQPFDMTMSPNGA